jgi:hypothetical protein
MCVVTGYESSGTFSAQCPAMLHCRTRSLQQCAVIMHLSRLAVAAKHEVGVGVLPKRYFEMKVQRSRCAVHLLRTRVCCWAWAEASLFADDNVTRTKSEMFVCLQFLLADENNSTFTLIARTDPNTVNPINIRTTTNALKLVDDMVHTVLLTDTPISTIRGIPFDTSMCETYPMHLAHHLTFSRLPGPRRHREMRHVCATEGCPRALQASRHPDNLDRNLDQEHDSDKPLRLSMESDYDRYPVSWERMAHRK